MKQKFVDYYMAIADTTSQLSSAIRLQVGAVIVRENQILATGYNGMPSGWENVCEVKEYCLERDINGDYFPGTEENYPYVEEVHGEEEAPSQTYKVRYRLVTRQEVLHAESNALAKVAKSTENSDGATLFCTHAPCIECAKLIYQSGIKKVYYRSQYRDDSGLKFLERGGVSVEKYSKS